MQHKFHCCFSLLLRDSSQVTRFGSTIFGHFLRNIFFLEDENEEKKWDKNDFSWNEGVALLTPL